MLHLNGRLGKGAAIAAAAAAVITAGTGIAVASASGPDITTATTIRLDVHGGTSTFVNVRHQPHPTTGDEFILSQPVFSAAHPAQRVGHGWVTVILVPRAAQIHATQTNNLRRIIMLGIDPYPSCTRPRQGTEERNAPELNDFP